MRNTTKPMNKTLARPRIPSRPMVIEANGILKPPPVGVVGVLLLPPLLLLFEIVVGTPDMGVGV